jgi:hypothetical protein
VLVGGQPALVTSITPNEITAIVPPALAGVSGAVDVEVDDLPIFYAVAVITSGISFDSGAGDALSLNNAPMNMVPIGVPIPFTVTAYGPPVTSVAGTVLTPAGGVIVIYTVTSGTAVLACGLPVCSVTATGDGRATMNVTAVDGVWSIVTASLTNGSTIKSEFVGGTPPVLASITPQLSLASGATFAWTVQAVVLNNGQPMSGQAVAWQSSAAGFSGLGSTAAISKSDGTAMRQLTVGPLTEGQTATIGACLNGTSQCVAYTAFGARPEYGYLRAISGTSQSLGVKDTPAQITLRLLDMDGNSMAGETVALYQALYAWAPPCAAHAVCPPSNLLATQVATAVSAVDGTVAFSPASLPGVATNLIGLAASDNTSTVNIAIEQHP